MFHSYQQQQQRSLFGFVWVTSFLLCLSWITVSEAALPNLGFGDGVSTPVLIVRGLRDPDTDKLAARIYDPQHEPAVESDRPPAPTLYDLTPLMLPKVDASSGEIRMFTVPAFRLNTTSQLRAAVWYPCYNRPEGVSILLMPCVFEALTYGEYAAGDTGVTTHPGRRVQFHLRYHSPPSSPHTSMTNESGVETHHGSLFAPELFDPELDDDMSPTTRATCWLPEPDALSKKTRPVKVEEQSHWIRVRSLHYNARREGSTSEEDPLPAAWYEYEVHTHGEVDKPKKDVILQGGKDMRGRKYCRSWLWLTIPDGYSDKWVVHRQPKSHKKE